MQDKVKRKKIHKNNFKFQMNLKFIFLFFSRNQASIFTKFHIAKLRIFKNYIFEFRGVETINLKN